jgi:hypothetical protein
MFIEVKEFLVVMLPACFCDNWRIDMKSSKERYSLFWQLCREYPKFVLMKCQMIRKRKQIGTIHFALWKFSNHNQEILDSFEL